MAKSKSNDTTCCVSEGEFSSAPFQHSLYSNNKRHTQYFQRVVFCGKMPNQQQMRGETPHFPHPDVVSNSTSVWAGTFTATRYATSSISTVSLRLAETPMYLQPVSTTSSQALPQPPADTIWSSKPPWSAAAAPTDCQALDSTWHQLHNCLTAAAARTLPSLLLLGFTQPPPTSTTNPAYRSGAQHLVNNILRLTRIGIPWDWQRIGQLHPSPLILFLEHQHCRICLLRESINWKFSDEHYCRIGGKKHHFTWAANNFIL